LGPTKSPLPPSEARTIPSLSAFEDHLAAPRGRGRLGDGPHTGAAGGAACGDLVRITVRVEGERVVEAGFDASGCAAAYAAGSAAVELVEGERLLDAARVGATEIAAALGSLVPSKRHAATLAADALHRALGAAAAADARLAPSPHRTLVAMSGGVDSAVAAHLAHAQGDEVVAVTLELWSDPANDGERSCCSPQAVAGARELAHEMGLPHLTLDLRERFRREVVDDFVRGHAAGRTPNPCVRCNGFVRFEEMLALAERLGAARLATGHYARVEDDGAGPLLAAAADARKDQTYMLARLEPAALARLSFPLAHRTKAEVRDRARSAGLPVAERAESQDLCFLAGVGKRGFLRRGERGPRRGEIVSLGGKVLGHHDGQEDYTVGQRRGLGLAASEPLYVLAKDAGANRVTVGPRSLLARTRVGLRDAVLHREGARVDRVKLRYRSAAIACCLEGRPSPGRHDRLALKLAEPVDGVAPGQTACLLAGERVVGCATIASDERAAVS
jgi:tRNA-specific 2-thiouridylase